ncbi:MAG: tyrosine-type recombinase/integrase [Nocardioides sp.]|jgi:integrase
MAPRKQYVGPVPGERGIRYRHKKGDPFTLRGYEVRYRDPNTLASNGESMVRGKIFRTLKEAKAFQMSTAQAISNRTYISPERGAVTWATVSAEWLSAFKDTLRPRTISGYEHLLRRHLSRWDKIAISDITREDVRRLIEDIRKPRPPRLSPTGKVLAKGKPNGLSQETEHKIFSVARSVFSYAVEERYINESPTDHFRKRLRKISAKEFEARPLTKEQAESIISNLPEGRYRQFGTLALWTGFRPGELAGLRVRNVDSLRCRVQVEDTIQELNGVLSVGMTKTLKSKGRIVPVPKAVMASLWSYIEARGLGPDDFVFAAQGEFFVYKMFARRQWRKAVKAAGFTAENAPRVYDLRHTFASLRAMEGVPPHVLKDWMGHTSIKTTMDVYTKVYQDDPNMDAIVERLYGTASENAAALPAESEGSGDQDTAM